jgi:hypothetical protein
VEQEIEGRCRKKITAENAGNVEYIINLCVLCVLCGDIVLLKL